MTLLIDGYNLLHAVGWATPRMPGRRLEAARRRLLDWLAENTARTPDVTVCVVFDAQNGPDRSSDASHRGVEVRFARHGTADDRIEELLASSAKPRDITIVSNDSRLHEAARRAGSGAWGSQQFLDWLIATEQKAKKKGSPVSEKPDGPTDAAEITDLLRAFEQPKPR